MRTSNFAKGVVWREDAPASAHVALARNRHVVGLELHSARNFRILEHAKQLLVPFDAPEARERVLEFNVRGIERKVFATCCAPDTREMLAETLREVHGRRICRIRVATLGTLWAATNRVGKHMQALATARAETSNWLQGCMAPCADATARWHAALHFAFRCDKAGSNCAA